jgi:hypothetical protein
MQVDGVMQRAFAGRRRFRGPRAHGRHFAQVLARAADRKSVV